MAFRIYKGVTREIIDKVETKKEAEDICANNNKNADPRHPEQWLFWEVIMQPIAKGA